jgi:hypothetical protein
MDTYKVISAEGARVRSKPSIAPGVVVLYTISRDLVVDVDQSVTTVDGFVWRHSFAHNGWIRSDMLERYAHSAAPDATPSIPPIIFPIDISKELADAIRLIEDGLVLARNALKRFIK